MQKWTLNTMCAYKKDFAQGYLWKWPNLCVHKYHMQKQTRNTYVHQNIVQKDICENDQSICA
jgi:hypothetical protein